MIQSLDRIADSANMHCGSSPADTEIIASLVQQQLVDLGARDVRVAQGEQASTRLVLAFMPLPVPSGNPPEEVALVYKVSPGRTDYSGSVVFR
ncbi:MAG: hypothetical protein AABX32_06125 [Nanoarchaeota archaeon]